MNILRNEIRTGVLFVVSVAAIVGILVYLGAPGAFVPQHTYRIFFDNASGIKPGAIVLLAGRKIGQVRSLYSPVAQKDRPAPGMETLIQVEVSASANIYRTVKVQLTQNSVLGESVIDFTSGDESSGLAPSGSYFLGERPGGLADAVPTILNKIDPVLTKLSTTLDGLQKTSENLTKLTSEGADLPATFSELRKFGNNLNELTAEEGPLNHALKNVETLTGENGKLSQSVANIEKLTSPESSLARTLKNAEKFTANLTENKDIEVTLRNFRTSSETFQRTVAKLGGQFSVIGDNLEQATETVKKQPWRLIWPTTKKYPAEGETTPPAKATPGPKKRR